MQEALRRAFECWGRPKTLRVDNGNPWGTSNDLPSALSLWLAGLGIDMYFNDPYRPWQNGVVESSQGTTQRWVEPGGCVHFEELCRRVAEEDWIQREVYPAINAQSRRAALPFLLHSGRGYCRSWERHDWDVQAALGMLANYQVSRKVGKSGQVSLYYRSVHVGEAYWGSEVYVQLDAASVQWVISDLQGRESKRRQAVGLTEESMRSLSIAKRSSKRSERRAVKRAAKRAARSGQQPSQSDQAP